MGKLCVRMGEYIGEKHPSNAEICMQKQRDRYLGPPSMPHHEITMGRVKLASQRMHHNASVECRHIDHWLRTANGKSERPRREPAARMFTQKCHNHVDTP